MEEAITQFYLTFNVTSFQDLVQKNLQTVVVEN